MTRIDVQSRFIALMAGLAVLVFTVSPEAIEVEVKGTVKATGSATSGNTVPSHLKIYNSKYSKEAGKISAKAVDSTGKSELRF